MPTKAELWAAIVVAAREQLLDADPFINAEIAEENGTATPEQRLFLKMERNRYRVEDRAHNMRFATGPFHYHPLARGILAHYGVRRVRSRVQVGRSREARHGAAKHRGTRRAGSGSASSKDPPEAEPPTRRRPDVRHISEATQPLLRGWLDRFNRTAAHAGLEPHERLELYLSLPADEQADHFAQLAEHERQERILDGDVEWPKPQIAAPTWVPARRDRDPDRDRRDDVLDTISPRDFWPALTGDEVPASGRVRCPAPGHEDVHPSCVVYSEPARGFHCFVCGAAGSAIDLAAIVTGIEPRGEGYWRLREWVAERILSAPLGVGA